MHAVVVRVTINEGPTATEYLRGTIVPRVSQAPGFVAGYWVRLEDGDEGTSTIVFESEEAARAAAERIEQAVSDNPGATINEIRVGEVVANA
jgi:hypothetical protein